MRNDSTVNYLGSYFIKSNKSLRSQLATKVPGLGFRNVDHFILTALGYKPRNLTFKDLTETQISKLEEIVTNGVYICDKYSNKKNNKLPDSFLLETNLQAEKTYLLLGTKLYSQMALDRKKLIKLGCYVGLRLKNNQKVHGQRTRSTGRKNKILKGFQRNKKKESFEKINKDSKEASRTSKNQ